MADQDLVPGTIPHHLISAPAAEHIALGTAGWMAESEAEHRYGFDQSLFAENADGLTEGRSNGQIWLGETFGSSQPIGYADDRHVCLVSGSRGGKGTSVIVPNLALWPGSCIVIDPKGENATVTARRRGAGSEYAYGMGQDVHILDPLNEVPLDPSLKARFNPLDTIDPNGDHAVDDAGRIAAALVVTESKTDPFFELAARNLLKGIILHVLTAREFKGRRNLVSVWRLITQGDWVTVAILREAGDKKIPSGFGLLWEAMRRSEAYNGLIAGTGQQMIEMADRTRSGVLKVAANSVEFIDGPPMQRLLEKSDFRLEELKTDPRGITLYLTLPQRHMETHFRWLRLMVTMAVGEMERIKGRPATGFPTLFLLDEFAGLKRMEIIENAAAQAAGAGIKFFFVVQGLTQLKLHYEDSWETFLGNSGLKLFFHIEDDFTRSYLSRQLGEHEVRRQTQSTSQSSSLSKSLNDGGSRSTTAGTSETDTTGTTKSLTTGHSNSITDGTSRSITEGRSQTVTDGTSRSVTDGTSQTRTEGDGWSDTSGTNSGVTNGTGRGRSSGFSFGNSWSSNSGSNSSNSQSTNRGWSRSKSRSGSQSVSDSDTHSVSVSRSASVSRSVSASTSDSTSHSASRSLTESTSDSQTDSRALMRSSSVADGISWSETHQNSKSDTTGSGEAVHKRSLLNPDEIGRHLARIDDRNEGAYPGRLIALLPGQQPIEVHRVNYFESETFAGLYDPHPNHQFPATLAELIELSRRKAALSKAIQSASALTSQATDRSSVIPVQNKMVKRLRNIALGLIFLSLASTLVFGLLNMISDEDWRLELMISGIPFFAFAGVIAICEKKKEIADWFNRQLQAHSPSAAADLDPHDR